MKNEEYKIGIERRISKVETKLEEIATNHLPHIQKKLDKVYWLLVTTLVALLIHSISLLIRSH